MLYLEQSEFTVTALRSFECFAVVIRVAKSVFGNLTEACEQSTRMVCICLAFACFSCAGECDDGASLGWWAVRDEV